MEINRFKGHFSSKSGLIFREVRYGIIIWTIAMAPLIIFIISAEILIDCKVTPYFNPNFFRSGSTSNIINYLTFSATHITISCFFIVNHFAGDINSASKIKQKYIKLYSLLLFVIISTLFIISLNVWDMTIEKLSHQLIFPLLKNLSILRKWFNPPSWWSHLFGFHPFSVFAIGLILLGELAGICITFQIAQIVTKMESIKESNFWDEKIRFLFKQFQGCVLKLVITLVTSSATTSVYFLMPISGKHYLEQDYTLYARSMSIYWGMVFSLMAFSILIWPYICYRKRLRYFYRLDLAGKPDWVTRLQINNSGLQLIQDNLYFVLSLVFPLLSAIISQLI